MGCARTAQKVYGPWQAAQSVMGGPAAGAQFQSTPGASALAAPHQLCLRDVSGLRVEQSKVRPVAGDQDERNAGAIGCCALTTWRYGIVRGIVASFQHSNCCSADHFERDGVSDVPNCGTVRSGNPKPPSRQKVKLHEKTGLPLSIKENWNAICEQIVVL